MTTIRLGLVGLGKIARDQHIPAIAATPGIELVAVASRNARADGVSNYTDLAAMLAGEPELDAVVLCLPPQVRYDTAIMALEAGKHVFLEKPPGATVSEAQALAALASQHGRTLFASWHSRYAAGVPLAKAWVAANAAERVTITWKEDVRHWHPGQDWIWQPGGFGVFDPGINALSILTEVMGAAVRLRDAELQIPSNRQAPIAARLRMQTASEVPIVAEFDFRQTGPQTWDIVIEGRGGTLVLSQGGNQLMIDGAAQGVGVEDEYPGLYRRFVDLVRTGRSDADLAPLQIVADAFLRGRMQSTDAFHD
ncbi:Gfo/Idh/MocA family oxidoreductase [Novosphingobium sp. PASSN1]|uniref:Gfo/Idh/MocA family protein n=1 Tax=Novosphingobium sp. PASSN1 TaxID=2015561 RepID=UPI000BC94EDA|nr:Gfo/Idh/MocA family oxidoreductase [Novosphingobium sp. PASSN1]OYU33867.1 MAG: galactose 1-dehydrogenase [Novosphingobium sp. PASSN1]